MIKVDFNDPHSIFYKIHDICTDIKDGYISDADATDKLLSLIESASIRVEVVV